MTKQLNKKGTSLVELIAVIVIMGIIAGIAIPTTIAVINRQKKNSALKSAENIYAAAKNVLLEASANGVDQFAGKVTTNSGDTVTYYEVTAAGLKDLGELEKNPLENNTTLTVRYTIASNSFSCSAGTFTINGVNIYWSETGCKFALC